MPKSSVGLLFVWAMWGCTTSKNTNETEEDDPATFEGDDGTTTDSAGDGDTDTDSDGDTDTDSDGDTDTDSDTDSNTDADADTVPDTVSDSHPGAMTDVDPDTVFSGIETDSQHTTDDTDTQPTVSADGTESFHDAGPIDTEAPDRCAECAGFKGVDILAVVDNSSSMREEQQILATGFLSLLNALVSPTESWGHDPAENVRLAVVSSDLGLQWGDDGGPSLAVVDGCEDELGDDGRFLSPAERIEIASGVIACDEGGNQCPFPLECVGGYCEVDIEGTTIDCPASGENAWFDTTAEAPNADLPLQAACLAQQGTNGCGVEQQLKASIRALSREDQSGFLRDDHVLAVLMISDEEDCSIQDPAFFNTMEWNSGPSEYLNVACNYPPENNEFLYDVSHFHDTLVDLKGGRENAVLFSAIVGVPPGENSSCQGRGDEIGACLDMPEMEMLLDVFETVDGYRYTHFKPACTREQNGVSVTQARPGRRYVELASRFGCAGYVYSICNEDWSAAMEDIARSITQCIVII